MNVTLSSCTCSICLRRMPCSFFFFNDTATTEIYTLSLHDALPISMTSEFSPHRRRATMVMIMFCGFSVGAALGGLLAAARSEEHTSELQSRLHLVCRLLLEKKKKNRPLLSP